MKKLPVFITLGALLLLCVMTAAMLGTTEVTFADAAAAIFRAGDDATVAEIIWKARMPRILLAVIVGAGLAVAGAVFQGMLRNPLADPFTLGISGGAAFGAVVAIIFKPLAGEVAHALLLPAFAFAGALLAVAAVYALAARKRFSVPALILGGVVMSFLFSSMVLFIFAVSAPNDVHGALGWIMGDLSSESRSVTLGYAAAVLAGLAAIFLFARDLDILTLGEEKATHLGVEAEKLKKLLFVLTSLVTAVCVAAAGIIGFVGLMVPHILRRFTGPGHRALIPAAALGGAVLLLACDTLARTALPAQELPVGVVTGILGGVFFLALFLNTKRWEVF